MTAFFLGQTERALFGIHHAPRGEAVGAVVLCNSWGREYQFAHRALRVLAKRLAERGLHVLRFDYSGVGDSWGHTTDGRVPQWLDDIDTAIEELRAMTGNGRVHLVGIRLGGLLAALVTARRRDVDQLVLWDPITHGTDWLATMEQYDADAAIGSNDTMELDGQLVSRALRNELAALSLSQVRETLADAQYPYAELRLLWTQPETADAVRETFGDTPRAEVRVMEDVAPWLEDPSIWSGLIPVKSIAAVAAWMAG